MLTKDTVTDKIEILEDGTMQVREATYILEDGVRIAGPIYHRSAHRPGEDVTHREKRIRDVASAVWTDAVIDAARPVDPVEPIETPRRA